MIVAIVPARGGSKRLANKNMQEVGGMSLVGWAITAGLAAQGIDRVYVSTDSQEILDHAATFATCSPFMRLPSAASDTATDRDVIDDFLARVIGTDDPIKLIVYLRPTTPLRRIEYIEQAIKIMLETEATGLRSVHEMSESAFKCFMKWPGNRLIRLPIDGLDSRFDIDEANLPNQQYASTYHPNGVVDIIRPEVLQWGPDSLFGSSVYALETNPVIEIDNAHDLAMCKMQHMLDDSVFTFRPRQ